MRTRRFLRTLTTLIAAPLVLAAALVGLGGTPASAATCQGWTGGQPPHLTDGNALEGVAVVSVCDVWAVGLSRSPEKIFHTVIEHWTGGSTWTQVQSPNPGLSNGLTAVTAVSPTNIWAVGFQLADAQGPEQPLIVHYDGTSWNPVSSATVSGGALLRAVSAVGASDIWAVGQTAGSASQTLTLHWDGHAWTQKQSPDPGSVNELTGVSGRTASNAWAVGDYTDGSGLVRTLILHWNGGAWVQVHSDDPSVIANGLDAVTAVSGNDAWAVGNFSNGTAAPLHTLIEHYDGNSWTQVPSPSGAGRTILFGVAFTSATSVWAVGYDSDNRDPITLHWDGTRWQDVPRLPAGSGDDLLAVSASSASNVWAVGGQGSGVSQSFAAPLAGTPGFQVAASMRGGTLYEAGLVNGPTSQSVAPGTSPAVALSTSGGSRIAWSGGNGHLLLIDQAGQRTDTGQAVATGTTPAITALAGGGGYETVFVNAADGLLWQVAANGTVSKVGGGFAVAPGTSPAIAANAAGGFQIAVHAAGTDDLWTIVPSGTGTDTGRKVTAGTSPAITALPGGYEVVFVNAAGGLLWQIPPGGGSRQVGPGYTLAAGTSPAIAPDSAGGYVIGIAAAGTGNLTTIATSGTGTVTGLTVAAGTSPALASQNGTPVIAVNAAAAGTLTIIDAAGLVQDTSVALTAGTTPAIAAAGPFVSAFTPVPHVTESRETDAEDAIVAAGLTVGTVTQDFQCRDFAGTVLEQSPASGLVPVGTPVSLTVANANDSHGHKCIIK